MDGEVGSDIWPIGIVTRQLQLTIFLMESVGGQDTRLLSRSSKASIDLLMDAVLLMGCESVRLLALDFGLEDRPIPEDVLERIRDNKENLILQLESVLNRL